MIRTRNPGSYKRRRQRNKRELEGELLIAKHYAKQRLALTIRQVANRVRQAKRHAKIQARRRRRAAEAQP